MNFVEPQKVEMAWVVLHINIGEQFHRKSEDKMKSISIILFVIALVIYRASASKLSDTAFDKSFFNKPNFLFEMLQHPYQPALCIYKKEYLDIANSFDFERSFSLFTNIDAVQKFLRLYEKGLTAAKETFSIYNENHRREAFALSDVMCSAQGKIFNNFCLIVFLKHFYLWKTF